MKIPKAAKRDARRLFRGCFAIDVFDEARARAVIEAVVREKPRHYLAILTVLQRLIRLEIARNTANIESATEMGNEPRAAIQQRLQQVYHRPIAANFRVNPALIGGVRITVGSDVWDGSVAYRLETLRAAA